MKTLSVNIPNEVDEKEIKLTIAAILFDKGLLSSGQAAGLAEVSKKAFLLNAGKYGVSVFSESGSDLNNNLFSK